MKSSVLLLSATLLALLDLVGCIQQYDDFTGAPQDVGGQEVVIDVPTSDLAKDIDTWVAPLDCLDGVCVCKPNCDGRECGGDGCGGSCGECSDGETCQDGTCAPKPVKCGDESCNGIETCCTCPEDCGSCCSNDACDCGETPETCPDDCEAGLCNPMCDPDLEECVEPASGGLVCASKTVEIPAGIFWMGCNNCAGSTENDTACEIHEHPYHEVDLDGYEIDKTEVTASQYQACVGASACTDASEGDLATYRVDGKENHPINHVSWSQAVSYCTWVGKRLATEAEWEKGARGGCEENGGVESCKAQSRRYPWGGAGAPSCSQAVMGDDCPSVIRPVCSKSPDGDSPYGLCDMAGNVWEWVSDPYQQDYYCVGDTATGGTSCAACGEWWGFPETWQNPDGPSGTYRVIRGGSFNSNDVNLRVSNRSYAYPSYSGETRGFRCAR